jgi:hypothetical protein
MLGKGLGPVERGACQGYFPLGGGAVPITPRKRGGEKNKNKKQRHESPILCQRLDLAAMATTRLVIPNARPPPQPRQCMLPAPAPGAAGSLINLG